jgi:hypothetical protein
VSIASYSQNRVLGEVQFVTEDHDGEDLRRMDRRAICRLCGELKDEKKVLLLPGEHDWYTDFTQKVVVEPGKKVSLHVTMQKEPRAQFPTVTSQLKLQVTPDRAAVFVDDGFGDRP